MIQWIVKVFQMAAHSTYINCVRVIAVGTFLFPLNHFENVHMVSSHLAFIRTVITVITGLPTLSIERETHTIAHHTCHFSR